MTSLITAIGGIPVPLKPKKAPLRDDKVTAEWARVKNEFKVTEKRAEAQNEKIAKPSEVWCKLPGGKRWTGFVK